MAFLKRLSSPDYLFNLPNLLTMARIFLIPILAVLLEYDSDQPPFDLDWMFRYSPGRVAAVVVALAGVTDLLDGYYARKWKIETVLGKFLDPLADKLLLMVGLVMLMKLGRVDSWMVIVLLSREFCITGLRGVAAGEGIIISAGQFGKLKLTFQLIGLGFLMWYGSAFGLPAFQVGTVILYMAMFISLFSGWRYLSDFFKVKKGKTDVTRTAIRPPDDSEVRPAG
jgi:CDP-diacylglycerol--glycerol-3-phosphate 3-phosphatidyltransferase